MGKFAWVTLATNDSYSMGALVLAHSLRRVNTEHQLVVLITPGVTEAMKTQLSAVFNVVKSVDVLDSQDADNLALLARPELGITFTKLHCWKLTEYEKCVFLDADTLVLQNSDELFEREELSAAPDAGWPDCFNSGVFVYKPSQETFQALIEFALIHGSFDGGDQGLLNLFFSDWATKDIKKHLPFVYNMCSTATYSYLPAFKQFGAGLKIIHFIGAAKPWLQPFNTETGLVSVSGESQHLAQFVQLWWDVFCANVHPTLSTEMTRHRLRTSYEFFTRPPPTMTFLSEQSYYFEQRPPTPPPPLFTEPSYREEKDYGYFDPWDEYVEQNDNQMSKESYMNYNNTVDNYLLSNNSSEINYGEHLSNFSSREFSNSEYIDDHRNSIDKSHSDHHFDDRSGHSVHTNHTVNHNIEHHSHKHSQPSSRDQPQRSEPIGRGGSSQPDVSSVSGGGNVQVHQTPSRRDSFSQLERTQSVPEIRVIRSLVENSHLHEPQALPMIHEPSQCESSSVHCRSQQHSSSAQSDDEAGLAGALATVTLGAPVTVEQRALEEHLRRQGWEQGNIDYMGKDSFANIWQKICETLGSTAPAAPPEDAPAPVAPVAAPVYVSSVEISPSGQIDKTPPQANYAPVSALKPTVEASDIKDAAKAPLSEATTVTPETKPSVTEVVATEASVSPSATLETSTPTPQIASEPPAAQQPATPVESAVKTGTTPQALSEATPAVQPTITSAPKEALPTVPPPTETPVAALTAAEEPTSSPVAPTPIELPVPTTPAPIPTEVPVPTTPALIPTDVPLPTTPTLTPTEVIVPTTPTSIPTEVPVPTTPTSIPTEAPVPTTPTSTPTEVPVPTTPISTPTEVPVPTTPTSIPTEVPVPTTPALTPTEVPVPATPTPIPTEVPVTTPALSEAPVSTPTPTEIPGSSPPATTPAQTPASTPSAPAPTETAAPTPPVSPASVQKPTEPSAPVPTEAPESVPTPTSESIASATKAEQALPQTPTVTEPTPPTSPPVAAEALQLTKLQVEADVPGTPPAGGSTQPSLEGAVADEPPVPPKRKGGSKAPQDSKNQKGGKPSKGKK